MKIRPNCLLSYITVVLVTFGHKIALVLSRSKTFPESQTSITKELATLYGPIELNTVAGNLELNH